MYVVEVHTDSADSVGYWEVSKRVPRDADGVPVEEGPLELRGGRSGVVLGDVATYPELIPFLKERDAGGVRVTEVEAAWKSAESGGPSSDCRIRPRGSAGTTPSSKPGMPARRAPSKPLRSPPKRPIPIVRWLVVAVILGALVWFFVL